MGNYMAEGDISNLLNATILESGKKANGMVRDYITMSVPSMKESGRITESMAREHSTIGMDTSIQANGMVIKDKEKLTTRTELSIQVNGMDMIWII